MAPEIASKMAEREALISAVKLMLMSARTAPKSGGKDDTSASIVYGKEKEVIARKMDQIARERKLEGFTRDAKNLRDSEAALLIGVSGDKSFGLDCGACGYQTCKRFEKATKKKGLDFTGPTCLYKSLDLGIALGSAAKTAGLLNVDNRIMYRVGAAAKMLGKLPNATIIMGIPVSATGKSIYFDRQMQKK